MSRPVVLSPPPCLIDHHNDSDHIDNDKENDDNGNDHDDADENNDNDDKNLKFCLLAC